MRPRADEAAGVDRGLHVSVEAALDRLAELVAPRGCQTWYMLPARGAWRRDGRQLASHIATESRWVCSCKCGFPSFGPVGEHRDPVKAFVGEVACAPLRPRIQQRHGPNEYGGFSIRRPKTALVDHATRGFVFLK